MPQQETGTPRRLLLAGAWRKSSHSNPSGDCLELAELAEGSIVVRNSRHPSGPTLRCTRAAMEAFLRIVKKDEFSPATGRP
jgi:hypothetical protein